MARAYPPAPQAVWSRINGRRYAVSARAVTLEAQVAHNGAGRRQPYLQRRPEAANGTTVSAVRQRFHSSHRL